MSAPEKSASLLTLRIDSKLARSLEREARRRRKTKSELAREILSAGLAGASAVDPAAEARRQSLLVSRRRSEKDALEFLEAAADTRGWK